jgi:hypothetical protein
MTSPQDEMNADWFISKGCEYYATARWGMHARRIWVSGNLFHHAVEMLLKSGLAKRGRGLPQLKAMLHNLDRLWREFKKAFPDPSLTQHDKIILSLHKFEDIRYPNPAKIKSMSVNMQWSGPPPKAFFRGAKSTPRQFTLIVSDVDALVADVIRVSSWNPGVVMGRNRIALTAIRRNNTQRKFLTKIIKPRPAKKKA